MKGERKTILDYKIEDDKAIIRGLIAVNLILGVICLRGNWANPRAQICIISGMIFLLLNIYYNWQSFSINVLLILVYLSIFAFEFLTLGIPEGLTGFKDNRMTKGFMFKSFIMFIPYIYIGIRLFFIFPLIQIIYSNLIRKE